MLTFSKIFLLCTATVFVFEITKADELKWWQTASFYQIYPRSFKDSDGDGIGDLKGITDRLAYLKEIGITATWLSPIFKSPMADFGYDVSDFETIEPTFGTMEDFEALLEKANSLGIKIILDFVPNHTSDEHEWFIKSAASDPEYKDFYVWHPGKIVDGERVEPTEWISVFRGSMWTWNEERQEYYLHQFHRKQPDLNYRNPKVHEAMKNVLRLWLRKGVSGFRVDAVPHVYEVAPDSEGNYPDEPRNVANSDPAAYDYYLHPYTTNQPETTELVYIFREVMDEVKAELNSEDLIIMTEAYAPLDTIMDYYGNDTVEGAQIPFNFQLISYVTDTSDANDYAYYINLWLNNMPAGRTANWVLGNHDKGRIGSRLGEGRMDMLNMLLLTLPGCSVNYQGEEIGMTDVWISWDDTIDPQACQSTPEEYETYTRDPCRTPFQWSDDVNAGFSTGDSTWLPVSEKFTSINVKKERGVSLSHLNVYKQLQKIRSETTIKNGDAEVKALNNNVLGIKRSLNGYNTFIILMNLMDKVENFNLNNYFDDLTTQLEVVVITDRSLKRKGDKTKSSSVQLMPEEAIVLRTVS